MQDLQTAIKKLGDLDLGEKFLIIIPICLNHHWITGLIKRKEGAIQIYIYDSLACDNIEVSNHLESFIRNLLKDTNFSVKHKKDCTAKKWVNTS